MSRIIIFIFTSLVYSLMFCQVSLNPTAITTNEGLGFRHVNCITQDKSGIIWIATAWGIERYDGNEFISFNNSKHASIKIPIDKAKKIENSFLTDETLLALANDKLFTIDLCSYEFEEFKLPNRFSGNVINFYLAKSGKLYLSVFRENQLFFIEYFENKYINLSKNKIENYLNTIQEDKRGNIWWANTKVGLSKYSPQGLEEKNIKLDSFYWHNQMVFFNYFVTDTILDKIYVFPRSNNAIWEYDEKNDTYKILNKDLPTPVYYSVTDRQKNVWFASKNQLLRYNPLEKEKPMEDYSTLLNNKLDFTAYQNIFIDRLNVMWISTNNGILKLPLSKQLFDHVLYTTGVDWNNEMRGIVQTENGKVYAFCENGNPGLYRIDKKSRSATLIFPDKKDKRTVEEVKHLVYDKKRNVVWCLTSNLLKIDANTEIATIIPQDISRMTSNQYHNPLALLKNGNLIFGFNLEKVSIYNPEKNQSTLLALKVEDAKNIFTEVFKEDSRGNIWIGTSKGLFIIDKNGKLFKKINENTNPALSKNHILDIYIDENDKVLIGTFGGGVNILEYNKQNQIKNTIYDSKLGLCDDNITAILKDKNNYIWLSTYNGVSRFDVSTRSFQNFYQEDGLTNNEFNYTSSMIDSDGHIWFGGMNGITVIDPEKALSNLVNPSLVLTKFSSFNRKSNTTYDEIINFTQRDKYEISPFISWFQFNWALPNYFNSEKNKYFVWLEGLETSWSYHGNNPYIRYNNLPHGEYKLKIKATDSKGNPSMGELSVVIIVKPFFYQTYWFNVLWILSVAGIFYGLYKYNLNKKLAMEKMRTQIASDLHDEVGSMLSGLAMQSELLQDDSNPANTKRFQNIADLSRSVVGKMRDLVWSIDSRSDTTQDLVDKMHEKLATMLGPIEISYRIDVGDINLNKHLSVNIRQQLYLIFNEAITNILRHSNAHEVIINIGNVGNNFILSIKDNGTNVNEKIKSTGMGLSNIRMRSKKINASYDIITHNGFEVKVIMKNL